MELLQFFLRKHPYFLLVLKEKGPYHHWSDELKLWEEINIKQVSMKSRDIFHQLLWNHIEEIRKWGLEEQAENLRIKIGNSCVHDTIANSVVAGLVNSKFTDTFNSLDEYLPVPNGYMINLRTGQMTERDYKCWFTWEIPTEFKGIEFWRSHPRFIAFIQKFCSEDGDLLERLMITLGYCITGLNNEQMAFVLYNEGSNGKSTLLELLRLVFGTKIADEVNSLVITGTNKSGPSPETMDLMDKRIAFILELSKNDKVNMSKFKNLTGDASVRARNLYEKMSSFRNHAKLLLATNDKMKIDATAQSEIRRIFSIPCRALFVKTQQEFQEKSSLIGQPGVKYKKVYLIDDKVTEDLKDTTFHQAFLSFCVEGAMRYFHTGFEKWFVNGNEDVIDSSARDFFNNFFNERIVIDGSAEKTSVVKAYEQYLKAFNSSGRYAKGADDRDFFIRMMRSKSVHMTENSEYFTNIQLKQIQNSFLQPMAL